MPTVRIEHPVPSFDDWKRVSDSDPAHPVESGVRRYVVWRPVDDPNFIAVDLDFDTTQLAEAFVARMRELWAGAGGQVSSDQRASILETVESHEY